ncbi:YciI family protein [Lysobacter tyrosinilyticus]
MQFLMLVYTDANLIDTIHEGEFDTMMRGCFEHADELRAEGKLIGSQQLESATTARTIRSRNGRTTVIDGPFAETKEMLAGFNILEADSFEEAVRIASEFPWSRFGSIEVRPVRDMNMVRQRVGAAIPETSGA